ncbi:MAG: PASTA domain-containing protein [Eubacteriales bacterium]
MNNKYQSFVGKVLDGRYKILELVGVGGMAFVLKAEDLLMDRTVAIKILNDEYNGDKQAEDRFINESKAVAMLSHKNLVSIYDVAIYPDMKYIVMEFLDGITLKEYLDKKGVLPWKEACIYTVQILRALEHTHSKGVIHRDIKPQNIVLQKNGEIKVTDFGIAKTPHETLSPASERAIGTVYYISPEQASSKETTFASDLYSVGIMLYEMVTGVLPFTADNLLEIAMMQINDEPRNPRDINPSIPVGVAQIIKKAMEKDPTNRFSSAHNMLKALDMILRNPAVTFSLGNDYPAGEKLPYNVVPIDSIATSELEPYDDGAGTASDRPHQVKKKKRIVKKRRAKTRKESRSLLPVISAVVLSFLLICLSCGVYYLIYALDWTTGASNSTEVTVPNLTGQIWSDELESKLLSGTYDSSGIKFKVLKVIEVQKNGYEDGEIIEQDPVAYHIGKLPDGQAFFEITSLKVNEIREDIVVPYLAGYTYKTAEIKLKEMGFAVEKELVYDDYAFTNQVIRTEPAYGSLLESGSTITVYVSMGRNATTALAVPDLTGLSLTEAKAALERAMLSLGTVTYTFDGDMDNTVMSQSVKAGTERLTTWAPIDIVISGKKDGTEYTEGIMPDLFGMTVEDAEDLLIRLGLVPDQYTEIYSSDYEAGTVCGQSIDVGMEVSYGDKIDLVICIGPGGDTSSEGLE